MVKELKYDLMQRSTEGGYNEVIFAHSHSFRPFTQRFFY